MGRGISKDVVKAARYGEIVAKNLEWFVKQADTGNAHSKNSLGLLYLNGKGVPQDYARARAYFEQAAEQGLALAQDNLGFLYRDGQGVAQDYARARAYYEQAAAQGL